MPPFFPPFLSNFVISDGQSITNCYLAMVNSERIRSLFREEVDKHPNVKQLGSLAQILFCKPLHTVTVLIQVIRNQFSKSMI